MTDTLLSTLAADSLTQAIRYTGEVRQWYRGRHGAFTFVQAAAAVNRGRAEWVSEKPKQQGNQEMSR